MYTKKITYQLLPFLVVVIMLLLSYWVTQWYFEETGIVGTDYSYVFQGINNAVPFIPATIYPYVIAYPFWGLSFFYIGYRNKKNMYTILSIILFTFTIAGLTYFFFQSDVQAWRETSGLFERTDLNFTESLVFWIYNAAGPRNANPSMHVIMSWLAILGARMDKEMPKISKIIIWVLGVSICISTQTLKQHYIIDLITGLLLVEVFFHLLKGSKIVDKVESFFTRINQKLHLE
ncbi:MAG: phosphatase PAP2 family protein [Candidatus Izemoplasmatales bacterium]